MSQILRLAVARVQAGKNPQDLAGALRRERDVALDESRGIELRLVGAAAADVVAEQRELGLLRHVDPGVLQERGEVVAGGAYERILEIEEPDPAQRVAVSQPQQVRRMEIAQHPGWRLLDRGLKGLAPERAECRAGLLVDRGAEPRQIPIEQQLGLDQE